MFLRKKKNKSGVISVQVIDKSSGKYKVIKTIGSSREISEIDVLINKGKKWIQHYNGQQVIDFSSPDYIDNILNNIKEINIAGISLLLGKIYDEIGFNKIDSDILKHLSIVKISHPASKLKTTEYLRRYYSKEINKDKIYRYLDYIYINQTEQIQKISYQHTLKILNGVISVVFYDVTTLYFQIDNEDTIRKRGFSKESRHQNP